MNEQHLRDTALGRVQAYSRIRDDCTGSLIGAVRGAYVCGASIEMLHIESGLDAKTLRQVVAGAGLRDTPTPGFARSRKRQEAA